MVGFGILPGDMDKPSLVVSVFTLHVSGDTVPVEDESVDMIDSNLRPERTGTVVIGVAVVKLRDPA